MKYLAALRQTSKTPIPVVCSTINFYCRPPPITPIKWRDVVYTDVPLNTVNTRSVQHNLEFQPKPGSRFCYPFMFPFPAVYDYTPNEVYLPPFLFSMQRYQLFIRDKDDVTFEFFRIQQSSGPVLYGNYTTCATPIKDWEPAASGSMVAFAVSCPDDFNTIYKDVAKFSDMAIRPKDELYNEMLLYCPI
jgi:hypothetical protein